jgi:hypothetical protein
MDFLRPAGVDLWEQQTNEDNGKKLQISKKIIPQREFWIIVHEREWKIYKKMDLTYSLNEVLIGMELSLDLTCKLTT